MNFNHKALTYGNEAVLSFFIFHQTIILCVGWFVIRWNIGIGPKYLIIAIVSFALIMALYDLLVRRFNVIRFLFGTRPKKKPLKNTRPEPIKDFRLIVKRLDRIGGEKVRQRPTSR